MNPTPFRSAVRRLAVARLVSIAGGAAAYTALMFTVYEKTHSATWLSATLLLTFGVNGLVSPFAGAIGDRLDRKRVMIVSDLLGVACFGAMAFAHDTGWLLGFAFLSAIVETPFWMASGAAIPNLVPEDRISWANGLVSLGKNLGITVGPAIGGVLLPFIGSSWVFGVNAISFALSAALVATVHGRFSEDRGEEHHEHTGMRAGFRFIAKDRVLRMLTLAYVVMIGGMGFVMVADVPLAEHFGAGSIGFGLMITGWGIGSAAGSFAGRWLNEEKEPRALFLGMLLVGFATAAIGVSPWFAPILAMCLFSGIGDAIAIVADQGIQQRRTPDVVRSRVMAAVEFVVMISYALALVFAGQVLRMIGPQHVYLIGGATALVGAFVFLPVVRTARRSRMASEPAEHELEPEPEADVAAEPIGSMG
ncbi:MAG: MFS transporter [Actinomycetota bacterium]